MIIRTTYCAAVAAALLAATPAAAQDAAPTPVLMLDEAVQIAHRQNHLVSATGEGVHQAEEREAALKTRRLPALHLDALGNRLLNSPEFTIPAGSLGPVPGLGAVPATNTKFTVEKSYNLTATASASQPLTQQYKIGLGLEVARLDREIASEDLRRERQRVAAAVRTSYYQISANEMGIVALRDLVRAVEEMDAVTDRYLPEGLVLRSDALDVKARLARERQRLAAAENALASQREHLNQLLGRDVLTSVRVAKPSELTPPSAGLTLEAARDRARGSRAEVHAASLRTAQADATRRLAVAGWIPDLSLVGTYTRSASSANPRVQPDEIATVGLFFTWEPFDWGRKSHEAAERAHLTAQAREGRVETEEQITVEVSQRWRAVKDAAALLEATRLEEQAVTASLETDQNRYKENATILRDLLRTEARLSGARHDYTDALAGYWSAVAELERTIGDEN